MFNIGDVVLIRDDLKVDKTYGIDNFIDDMVPCIGKSAKITEIFERGDGYKYNIDIDKAGCFWTEEMFLDDKRLDEDIKNCLKKISNKIIFKQRECKKCSFVSECETFRTINEDDNTICGIIDLINSLIKNKEINQNE